MEPPSGRDTRHPATILRRPSEVDDRAGNLHAGALVWLAEPPLTRAERARFGHRLDRPARTIDR